MERAHLQARPHRVLRRSLDLAGQGATDTAMPPSGMGSPVVPSHHSPRSTRRRRPWEPKVKRPSWMMTPASTSPAATAGMMRSKGMITGLSQTPGEQPRRSAAVVRLPGDGHSTPC